jgi:hypothetical protein
MKKIINYNLTLFIMFFFVFTKLGLMNEQKSKTLIEEEISDYKEYINQYKKDIDTVLASYNTQMKMFDEYSKQNFTKAIELKSRLMIFHTYEMEMSNSTYLELLSNFQNVTRDYEKNINLSKDALKGYDQEMKMRKKMGISDLDRLLNNFFNVNKTKQSLKSLQKILEMNDNKKDQSNN